MHYRTWNLRGLDGSEEGEGGELSQQPEDMDGVVEEFEDVVLDQEGPGVGIHMFIFIVNTIDISALLTHRGQAPVPPSFSLFNRGTAGNISAGSARTKSTSPTTGFRTLSKASMRGVGVLCCAEGR